MKRTRYITLLAALLMLGATATADAEETGGLYARLGAGAGVGQDFVSAGITPLPGISGIIGGGFKLTRDARLEATADVLGGFDLLSGAPAEAILQGGLHAAFVSTLPRTRRQGFAMGGPGIGVTGLGEAGRVGGSILFGGGWVPRGSGEQTYGFAAFYAARVVGKPVGFVHTLHVDVFLLFDLN